ncbi:hypothetical protein FE374_17590 [Georgenia yuyongxinii]|uniref:SsuA/THI5-like domain-containing protein n=1 Tax=Georgenia yuyongxinii TaxID=2589797 RepID=A0A5B8CB22_9MICO|nr:hypothetical protein FE374_17590 [Georgenia yuyongxinii]
MPIIDVAPVYVGLDQGFFEEEGLELELSTGQGGAAIVPGVVSGSTDFGFGNNHSLMIAASSGLPLRVVASGGGRRRSCSPARRKAPQALACTRGPSPGGCSGVASSGSRGRSGRLTGRADVTTTSSS